jgi:hypothetical protein
MISKHCQGAGEGRCAIDLLMFYISFYHCAKCENESLVCFASLFLGGKDRSLCLASVFTPKSCDCMDNSITC